MKYSFVPRAVDVPSAGIDEMMKYAAKYQDVLSLGQGTPLFPTPEFIYEYLNQRSKTDVTIGTYSGPKIENELKELIVKKMHAQYGFIPKLDELYLTVGGIGGLFASLMALVQKGDEVIYFDPSYPLHLSQIHIAEATPTFVPYDEAKGWVIDLELFEKSITPHTKVVILTNPNNPTGTIISEREVRRLAEIILKHNLILILDEAYDFLTYENKLFSPLLIPELRHNIIVSKSFSKEFAMTGWRIGYVFAHEELIKAIHSIHLYYSIRAVTPAVVAGIAALSDERGSAAVAEFVKQFTASRETICQRLDRLPKLFLYHKPQGAYYVFPKILHFDIDAKEFARMVVDEAHVITIPGNSMGPSGKGHIRMSFAANPTVIHKTFDRIDEFAKKHKLF